VAAFERDLIADALERAGHIQTRAARLLGVTRRILKYKMDTLGIPVLRPRARAHGRKAA
jgi:transcriptional regulator with GAF, ATPase, and Fis domain